MSALPDALKHPANRPGALTRWLASQVAPGADLSGLQDAGGVVCDFRPGLEEKNPSLSVSVGQEGAAVFRRHGGDDAGMGALAFTASCLNVPKSEAARLLIERAGMVDRPAKGKARQGPQIGRTGPAKKEAESGPQRRTPKRQSPAEALEKLSAFGPRRGSDLAFRLRGLRLLEEEDGSEAAQEVTRRGLWPAVRAGVLRAYALEGGAAQPAHSFPGALFFEVRGPDGQVWAVKFRNTDAALSAQEEQTGKRPARYAYTGKGGGRPAWCAAPLSPDKPTLIFEGELNAAAGWTMLEALGLGDAYNIIGVASAGAWPHVPHLREGSRVYVFADMGDKRGEGDAARENWGRLCAHFGAQVFQLGLTRTGEENPFAYFDGGAWQTKADACDALGTVPPSSSPERVARFFGEKLRQALEDAAPWQPAPEERGGEEKGQGGDVWLSKREGFGLRGGVLCALSRKKNEEGEEYEAAEALANFAAFITAQVQTEDGTGEAPLTFEVSGQWATGEPMRPLAPPVITAAEFAGMSWPVRVFGARAIVRNGQGRKDKAREAVQQLSNAAGFPTRTVYGQTGWLAHPEHGPVFLTAGAVIGAQGAVSGVEVDLGSDLSGYALPDPDTRAAPGQEGGSGEDLRAAVRASLALLDLAPDAVAVPLLGAAYRAALGRSDFAVWATGETGRNKTAFMGLAQSHYGAAWNRHRLPEGWQSTSNALEKTAHTLKDVLLIVDDFKPGGTQTDVSRAHGNLTRTLQGVADGTGRGRMGIDRKRRAGMAPRGTVMSSSETLPRGHSNRARVVVVPVESKLIHSAAMSEAYYAAEDRAARGVYALATSGFARFLALNFEAARVGSPAHKAMTRALAPHFEGAHGRTGPAAAELAYGYAAFLTFAVDLGALEEGEARAVWARVVSALRDTAQGQGEHLREEDPVTKALALLSGLLSQGAVFLEDAAGEEAKAPPEELAHLYGWQVKSWQGAHGGEGVNLSTRPGARLIGYYAKSGGDEWGYFLPEALHAELQKAAQAQGQGVLPDASTLFGNMKDRFHARGLMRCEVEKAGEGKTGRVRPYYKATARGQRGRFVALRLPIDPEALSVGTMGTMGTDRALSTSGTVSGSVPTFNIFSSSLGTMGTPSLMGEPSSSPALSPDLPGALPEDLPAEDLGALEEWAVL